MPRTLGPASAIAKKRARWEFAKKMAFWKMQIPASMVSYIHSIWTSTSYESDHISGNVGPNFINHPQNHLGGKYRPLNALNGRLIALGLITLTCFLASKSISWASRKPGSRGTPWLMKGPGRPWGHLSWMPWNVWIGGLVFNLETAVQKSWKALKVGIGRGESWRWPVDPDTLGSAQLVFPRDFDFPCRLTSTGIGSG